MNNTIRYLEEVFGVDLNVTQIQKQQTNSLPFYLASEYTFWEAYLLDRSIVFAEKNTPEHFTPEQYKKQLEVLETNFKKNVVFVLPDIEAYKRNRVIQKHINFIIANKQIFIPSLMVDIKEYTLKTPKKEYLQPAAQFLILYHLQKEQLNHNNYKELADKLNYSYLTITRAVENIQTLNLCNVEGTKEKTIYFQFSNAELWENALAFMRSPVVKKVFIDDEINNELLFKTNINALAYYTDLNDEQQLYFAVQQDVFRKLHKKGKIKMYSDYDGRFSIETWRYDPAILANNDFVDPLSLYLEFKESKDERVQMALKTIIQQQKW